MKKFMHIILLLMASMIVVPLLMLCRGFSIEPYRPLPCEEDTIMIDTLDSTQISVEPADTADIVVSSDKQD